MLEIQELRKLFGTVKAVDSVSLTVPDGAFLVLLGPSGCGKTTLLRMLAGLETATSGQIAIDGKVVTDGHRNWAADPSSRNIGLVFQSYALWPHMSVGGNVDWPLKVAGMDKTERQRRVAEVLELLGISDLARRYPNEISGGQQQRVAIARTIAPRPKVLLFDEPLSNLDAKLRIEMRTELLRLHRATGATSVYVTHDQIEAMTMASHVAVMHAGRVEQFGEPDELIAKPASAFVATFVGTPPGNLIPVEINGTGCLVHGRRTAIVPASPEAKFALFRAESLGVSLEPTESSLPMELAERSTVAGRTMLTAIDRTLRLTVVVDDCPHIAPLAPVHVSLPRQPDCWFDGNGRRIG